MTISKKRTKHLRRIDCNTLWYLVFARNPLILQVSDKKIPKRKLYNDEITYFTPFYMQQFIALMA